MDYIGGIIYGLTVLLAIRIIDIEDRKRQSARRAAESRKRLEKEIEAAGRRITLDMWRYNIGKRESKEPLRKACGVFSDNEAQKLVK